MKSSCIIDAEKVQLYNQKENCSGCGACLNACNKNAISMEEDEYGFLYPEIDEAKCVNCRECEKVCAFNHLEEDNVPIKAYAAVSLNTDIMQSAAGGVFASLAKSVIKSGGIVYGASMEKIEGKLRVVHVPVNNVNDLIKLQGSKYVQSNTGLIYRHVKAQLDKGRKVLFSGTPCQVAGLKQYLGSDDGNLFTIDLICSGVPNQKMFNEYILQLEKKVGGEITSFKFHDKSKEGNDFSVITYFRHGNIKRKTILNTQSSYVEMFSRSATQRVSCYSCKYASQHRPGDITLGSYLGIEQQHPELLEENGGEISIEKGVSCVIENTLKGKSWLLKYINGLKFFATSFDQIAHSNTQLSKPAKMHSQRDLIMQMYKDSGYKAIEHWFDQQIPKPLLKKSVVGRALEFIKGLFKRLGSKGE